MRRIWLLGALLIVLPALPVYLFALLAGPGRIAIAPASAQDAGAATVAQQYLADAFNPWRVLSALVVLALAVWIGRRWGGGVTRPAFWGFLAVIVIYPTPMHIAMLVGEGGAWDAVWNWLPALKTFDIATLALPVVLVLFALTVTASARLRSDAAPRAE
ncbi:hypothetical protein GCM10027591_13840 [Zhihengliuella somnathii]